ncbi:hypothetical protein GA0115239_100640 [Streptomyces sp. BpilaLS-43]|nr:hypothetical protein GA0115239_100640 [Streptomyces sp. BpilaLS-43]
MTRPARTANRVRTDRVGLNAVSPGPIVVPAGLVALVGPRPRATARPPLRSAAPSGRLRSPEGAEPVERRAPVGRAAQRSPAKRSFSGTAAPVASFTRTKVSMPMKSANLSLPILRKKMFSP